MSEKGVTNLILKEYGNSAAIGFAYEGATEIIWLVYSHVRLLSHDGFRPGLDRGMHKRDKIRVESSVALKHTSRTIGKEGNNNVNANKSPEARINGCAYDSTVACFQRFHEITTIMITYTHKVKVKDIQITCTEMNISVYHETCAMRAILNIKNERKGNNVIKSIAVALFNNKTTIPFNRVM